MTAVIVLKVIGSVLTAACLIGLAEHMAALARYRRSKGHCKMVTTALAVIYLAIMFAMWSCG